VVVFPPPGPDRRDSFFAKTTPERETPGREYVGIAAQGRSLKVVYLRALVALMGGAQALYAQGKADPTNPVDPYMTLVGYFNSLRELGGSRRIAEDEVSLKLKNRPRRRIEPAEAMFEPRNIQQDMLELTSRVATDDVAAAKERLGKPFSEGDKRVDLALATNMISVGLDITRLGLMVMLGQPKTSSEYIQASSRVGRDRGKPGLVVVLLNIHKPRDRSHYERFESFHASFYRSVEATSVTPGAPRSSLCRTR
jgi:Helicase conserved C-terminal domain